MTSPTGLGSNPYAGTTVANGATLDLQADIGPENVTLGSAVGIGNPSLISSAGSGAVEGNITMANNAVIGGAGNLAINGTIYDYNGGFGLTKSGNGVTVLSGMNSYGGATTINAGTLRVQGGSAIPSNGTVVLANSAGATFDLAGSSQTIGVLTGGGANGGNVTLGAGGILTVGNAASATFNGAISDSGGGGIVKQGNGLWTLTGSNTYTGQTSINGGTLQVGANNLGASIGSSNGIVFGGGALVFTPGDTMNVPSPISGNGNVSMTGSGNLILAGVNSFNGNTVASAGTLTLTNDASVGTGSIEIVNANTLAVANGATVTLAANQNLTIDATGPSIAGLGVLNVNGNFINKVGGQGHTLNNQITLNLDGNTYLADTTPGRVVTFAGSGATTLSGVVFDSLGSGTGSGITFTPAIAAASLTIGNNNAYTGITTLNGPGTTYINADTPFGTFGQLVLNNNTPVLQALTSNRAIVNSTLATGNPTVTGANNIIFNNTFEFSGGNRTLTNNISGGSLTLSGNVLLSDSSDATARTQTMTGPGSTYIEGVIANGGAVNNLTYSGAGSLYLDNANTFSGAMSANSGIVNLGHSLGLQNATVTLARERLNFGSLITSATFGGLAGSGGLNLLNGSSAPVGLTVGNNHTSTTYTGALSDFGQGGSFTVSGGSLNLSGNGSVDVAGGIFVSGSGAAFIANTRVFRLSDRHRDARHVGRHRHSQHGHRRERQRQCDCQRCGSIADRRLDDQLAHLQRRGPDQSDAQSVQRDRRREYDRAVCQRRRALDRGQSRVSRNLPFQSSV